MLLLTPAFMHRVALLAKKCYLVAETNNNIIYIYDYIYIYIYNVNVIKTIYILYCLNNIRVPQSRENF